MDTLSYVAKSATPMLFLLVAVVGALVGTRRHPERTPAETWVRWWAVSALGCGSLWMTLSFLLMPATMADAIGFTRTPFMFEIAFANLALAVLAFRARTAPARERLTAGLAAGAFLWGATIGHLYQWFANGDHHAGNTGGILVYDVLVPAIMIVLARRAGHSRREPAVAASGQSPAISTR
ncbi:DUF6790 family protein [Streptomyces sp. NRRL F-5126]|uniref:DUF6790 family protein n=1 Tax=Streptomyces sp. NRRL F-5126 TaxID=1463857 RepID=UPI0006914939|nr:DUF6790 family protein [Streptomyces sp. NRRL F-5126]